MEYFTKSAGETQKLAGKILKDIFARPSQGALVLALEGDLGTGKTTFTQGLAKALGVKEKILSPTFVILKRFTIYDLRFKNFYHLDCYRIEKAKDLEGLGLEEILKDKNNLVVIEWAERMASALPADAVWIKFEHGGEDRRKLKM